MQFTRLPFVAVAVVSVLVAGCSGSRDGGSAARVDQRDGIAVCVLSQSDNVYKLGMVENDQVKLYATYGGVTLALKDVEEAVSNIAPKDVEDANFQQRAIANALFSLQLPGIWKVETVSIDGQGQTVRDDDPNYLVIRADKTYRIIKKGRKPEGTWMMGPKGELVLNSTNDESKTAEMRQQRGDKLELTFDDGGSSVLLRYNRTNLTEEPKAVDEE